MDTQIYTEKTTIINAVAEKCTDCGICRKHCLFLEQNGTPGAIARNHQNEEGVDPHECSLCGLCSVVCPEKIEPASLFPVLRRGKAASPLFDEKPYKPVLQYESLGSSRLLSLFKLPEGGDTVFFPGCALPSIRPQVVWRLFGELDAMLPRLGISLGCCMKPSHDIGRHPHFTDRFGQLHSRLAQAGVKKVITACPNCQAIFAQYGGELEVVPVYSVLAEAGFVPKAPSAGQVVVHDPCPQRHDPDTREAVRELANRCGFEVVSMDREGPLTRCCGEGGMVKFINPELAGQWTRERSKTAAGRAIVTSCAGCVNHLKGTASVRHVLDELLGHEPSGWLVPPLTYAARLWLKYRFARLPQFR